MRAATKRARGCFALLLLAMGLWALAGVGQARAAAPPDEIPGFDISWPQCGKPYPPGPVAFTIVGINGGKPYTPNPCFLEQYRWAQRIEARPAVYVNVDYPKPGRIEAATGPYGTCVEGDDWCRAYNYGYGIGREVVGRAGALHLAPAMWWLDVETGNYWSEDPIYNAQVVRGVIDFLRERNLPAGIYSTPRQWRIIAGSYAPGLPAWTAGAQGIDDAARRCLDPSYGFGGGSVRLVQYYDFGFDTNYLCPAYRAAKVFPADDPFGRLGPVSRTRSPAGAALPYWQVIPMLAN